jgi:hypothetical protein
MSAWMDRARSRAEERALRMRQEAGALIAEALPGVRAEIEGEVVRLTGRDVRRRWHEIAIDALLRSHLR